MPQNPVAPANPLAALRDCLSAGSLAPPASSTAQSGHPFSRQVRMSEAIAEFVEKLGDFGGADLMTSALSCSAKRLTLLHVQRKGRSGSPHV
jgi:hypothetical protein